MKRRFLSGIMLVFFLSGCSSQVRVLVSPQPVPKAYEGTATAKINLDVKKGAPVKYTATGETSLQVTWDPKSGKEPKYVAEGDAYKAIEESIRTAVTGAGYEIAPTGDTLTVHVLGFGTGLSFQPVTPTAEVMGTLASLGFNALTGGIFFSGPAGGNPCAIITGVAEKGPQSYLLMAKRCKTMGFETTENYSMIMREAIADIQMEVLEVAKGSFYSESLRLKKK